MAGEVKQVGERAFREMLLRAGDLTGRLPPASARPPYERADGMTTTA